VTFSEPDVEASTTSCDEQLEEKLAVEYPAILRRMADAQSGTKRR
jgi:hypothetical protein